MSEVEKMNEANPSAAKLVACNERMRERIVEIAHLANECLLNTNHPNGYEPGQFGKDYRTYGKAISEIRKTCKESMAEECVPDYEWLAKIMTCEGFDPDQLAKAIEAEASQRPIDYPTFYTPGWLCELAKKLEAQEPIREDSPDSPDSRSEAKAEKNDNLEFYGLKLNRFGGAGLGTKLIGKRVNVDKTVQVFEIEVKRGNLATGARAFVTENGELLFSLVGGKSFVAVEQMAVSALHRLLKRRADHNKRKNLARKAKRSAAKGRKQG